MTFQVDLETRSTGKMRDTYLRDSEKTHEDKFELTAIRNPVERKNTRVSH